MSAPITPVIQGLAAEVGAVDPRRSLPELIFGVVSAALADAGCTMADVDGIVLAAHDLVDGLSLSSMITGPAAGAYLRDEIRVSDDGLVALSLGAARIEAGEAGRVVVAAWGRASEGDPARTSRVGFEPVSEQPLGLDETVVSALRASAYLRRYPAARRDDARTARRARAGGVGAVPPTSTSVQASSLPTAVQLPVLPLRSDEVRVLADTAAAVVLGRDGSGPRITGIGHGTDRARIGDRDLVAVPAARDAVAAALRAADRAIGDVDVVELAGPTLFDEILVLEAAGLAPLGDGMGTYADQGWINPTGGAAGGDCYPCSGLLRAVTMARQLRGEAGESQLAPRPTLGLVVAGSAVAQQTVTAAVLEQP